MSTREYSRQRRQKWQARIRELLGGKCVLCGATTQLEVHHKDPAQKRFDPGRMSETPRTLGELKKCELLCMPCHHLTHHPPQHGTRAMYLHRKCRCELCVEAANAYMRAYLGAEKQRARMNEWKKKKRETDPAYRDELNRKLREYRLRRKTQAG